MRSKTTLFPGLLAPKRVLAAAANPAPATIAGELLETRDQLRAVLDGLPAMIGYWDTELRNTMANAAYVEWFGFTPEEMKGLHIREVLGEALFALNEPHMRKALKGEPQLFDRTIIDASGATRHTQASYLPDIVENQVKGFFVLVTDITARKLAEDALADESARVRTILEAVTDAVISLDVSLTVTDMNAAAAAMIGVPAEEAYGRLVDELIALDCDGDPISVAEMCTEVAATGTTRGRSETDELRTAGGAFIAVDWIVAPIRTAGGELRGLVVTLRDVHDSRRVLKESRRMALHDPLTGAKNRSYLEQLSDRPENTNPASVVFVDLDGFKTVNDERGHAAGDEALQRVAELIRAAIRTSDDVIRVGGDEFVLLLHQCNTAGAQRIATQVIDSVRSQGVGKTATACLGVSAGIAHTENLSSDAVAQAIARADAACYRAKRAGGQRVVVDRDAASITPARPAVA